MNEHPTTATALCRALELAINKALQYDPATQQRLAAQAGRSVCLQLTEPSITLTLRFEHAHVAVSPVAGDAPDCTLSGKSRGVLQLLSGPKTSLAGSELTLTGQTGFLMELLDIAKQLDIDWEAIICQYFGDIAGHSIAQLLRAQGEQWQRLQSRAPHFLQSFLTEELQAIPSRPELAAFNDDIDDLRDDVERLEARINHIKHSLTS
ncbi:MAG TPA: SCP2 sterol-binding domain-containing protein [Marinagarivorans sp.]